MTESHVLEGVFAADHPAVRAWERLRPSRPNVVRVIVLQERKRSGVYRLELTSPAGSTVIAKRSDRDTTVSEVEIYRDILRGVPVRTLECFGHVDDLDPAYAWLFLEDAGDEAFSVNDPTHRVLAGQWLGHVHAADLDVALARSRLPHVESDHWRAVVLKACHTIQENLGNPAFRSEDVVLLKAVVSHGEALIEHWDEVEAICRVMPSTLVHGDFGRKNLRVRTGPTGLELFPIDWDSAGRGCAAPDLAHADTAAYCARIRPRFPHVDIEAVTRFADVGRMLAALEPVTGEGASLRNAWVGKIMKKMAFYHGVLTEAAGRLRWSAG